MKQPTKRKLNLHTETWRYTQPFRIAGRSYTDKTFVVVELSDGQHTGRGEAWHLYYAGETLDSVISDIESVAADIQNGLSREQLQQRLPAGGARNALDLALWDLDCQQQQKTIWQLTGITPQPLTTTNHKPPPPSTHHYHQPPPPPPPPDDQA